MPCDKLNCAYRARMQDLINRNVTIKDNAPLGSCGGFVGDITPDDMRYIMETSCNSNNPEDYQKCFAYKR